MFSSERPSQSDWRPSQRQGYQPTPRPFVPEDTIRSAEIQVERKLFILTLKENPRGRFLRITEEAGTKRNTIIIPITGLQDFQHVVNEMLKAAETLPAPSPDEVPGDSIGNR